MQLLTLPILGIKLLAQRIMVGINNITRYILLFGLSIKDSIPYVILFAE